MRLSRIAAVTAALAVLPLALRSAAAQEYRYSEPTIVVEEQDEPSGFALVLGGGIADFPDGRLNDLADPGLAWDVRAIFGARSPLGFEVAYVGSTQDLDTRDGDAMLMKNGVEANLRLNLATSSDRWHYGIYGIAGAGWSRFDVTNEDDDFERALLGDDDNIFTLPVGAGFALGYDNFRWETRLTYRFAFGEDLIDDGLDTDDAREEGMDQWTVSALVGFEF